VTCTLFKLGDTQVAVTPVGALIPGDVEVVVDADVVVGVVVATDVDVDAVEPAVGPIADQSEYMTWRSSLHDDRQVMLTFSTVRSIETPRQLAQSPIFTPVVNGDVAIPVGGTSSHGWVSGLGQPTLVAAKCNQYLGLGSSAALGRPVACSMDTGFGRGSIKGAEALLEPGHVMPGIVLPTDVTVDARLIKPGAEMEPGAGLIW
jgi:hypothetical protein